MDLLIAVGEHTSDRVLGMLGDPGVNVLELNVALDAAATVERESMSVSERRRTGTLRVYLGAAPGVGKTCAMLGEGHRRGDRGADVVVGFVETHGRDFTVSVDPGLPPVAADAALLERAVANLVSNAVTASRGHHPVGVEAGLVSAERLDLRIVDRGPGLPEEDRIRLFELFQRFDDRGGPKGLGLGLAIAHRFVDSMGGELVLDDTPGGGVTATIRLQVD